MSAELCDQIKNNTTMEPDKLKLRCIYDIYKFHTKNPITMNRNNAKPYTTWISKIINMQNCPTAYDKQFDNLFGPSINYYLYITEILKNNTIDKPLEYSLMVPKMSDDTQKMMWVLRTLLCYNLLIEISTNIPKDQKNQKKIYNPEKYKLGIFGSNTPTSDIDIGFTYNDNFDFTQSDTRGPLSWVIEQFEQTFINKTKLTSLNFDIEPYANFMTLTDGKYYLNTNQLTYKHFIQLSPYVGAGILRNYIQSFIDLGYNVDIRRQKINHPESEKDRIMKELNAFMAKLTPQQSSAEPTAESTVEAPIPKVMFDIKEFTHFFETFVSDDNRLDIINALFGNTSDTTKETAIGLISDYLLTPYNDSRKKYYQYVFEAEKYYYGTILKTNVAVLEIDQIVDMLRLSSRADIFRAESYISPITVMDVVRGNQGGQYQKIEDASKENPSKDLCAITTMYEYAPCLIGTYGYIISILENLGYITRFRLSYCNATNETHFSQKNCEHKVNEKYLPRVVFSFGKLLSKNPSALEGFPYLSNDTIEQYIRKITYIQQSGGKLRRTRVKRQRVSQKTRRRRHSRNKRVRSNQSK